MAVTLINLFEVPAGGDEAFIAGWERARDFLAAREGLGATALHRALREDAEFRFANVAVIDAPDVWRAAVGDPAFPGREMPFEGRPALYETVHEDGSADGDDGVVLINPFEVPDDAMDEAFLAAWEAARGVLAANRGYLGTRLHRSLGPANFRFVNIARWSSPLMFQPGREQTGLPAGGRRREPPGAPRALSGGPPLSRDRKPTPAGCTTGDPAVTRGPSCGYADAAFARPASMPPTSQAPARAAHDRLRLLLVEDDDGDAFLVRSCSRGAAPSSSCSASRTLAEAVEALLRRARLRAARPRPARRDGPRRRSSGCARVAPDVAHLVLTGLDDEQRGVEAVAAGAQDYLVKGSVDGRCCAARSATRSSAAGPTRSAARLLEARAARRGERAPGARPAAQPLLRDPALGVGDRLPPRPRAARCSAATSTTPSSCADGTLHVLIGDVAGHGPDEAALGVCLRDRLAHADARAAPARRDAGDAAAGAGPRAPPRGDLRDGRARSIVAPDRRARGAALRRPSAAAAARRRRRRARSSGRVGPPLGVVDARAGRRATRRAARGLGAAAVHRRPDRGPRRRRARSGSAIEGLLGLRRGAARRRRLARRPARFVDGLIDRGRAPQRRRPRSTTSRCCRRCTGRRDRGG